MDITKEEKLEDIKKAEEMYRQADELIKKADKLIKRKIRGVDVVRDDNAISMEPYRGMVEVHLYKGILRLEKLLGVKAEPEIRFDGSKARNRKVLCINGIKFFQIGEATQSRHHFK